MYRNLTQISFAVFTFLIIGKSAFAEKYVCNHNIYQDSEIFGDVVFHGQNLPYGMINQSLKEHGIETNKESAELVLEVQMTDENDDAYWYDRGGPQFNFRRVVITIFKNSADYPILSTQQLRVPLLRGKDRSLHASPSLVKGVLDAVLEDVCVEASGPEFFQVKK